LNFKEIIELIDKVADRGIAGGMTNDVTYLGISSGASVPPGSDSAETRPTLLLQGRRVAAPAIPTAL